MDETTKKILLMLLSQKNEDDRPQHSSGSSRGVGAHNFRGRGRGSWRGSWRGQGQGQRQPFYARYEFMQPYNSGNMNTYWQPYGQPYGQGQAHPYIYGFNPYAPAPYNQSYLPPPPLPPVNYNLTVNPPPHIIPREEYQVEAENPQVEKHSETG